MENRKRVSAKLVKNRKKVRDGKRDINEGIRNTVTNYVEASAILQTPVIKQEPPLLEWLLKCITKNDARIFVGLLLFRITNALLVRTFFVPDEYWQSTEVAHRTTFGYGYLTWEWRVGIRSYLYPFCFSCYFYLLKIMQLDSRILITKGPMILQAFLAAVADLYVYKTAFKLSFNHRVARWTLLCQLTSWYLFYTSTRTLSNSTEGSLVSIALYFLPWSKKPVLDKEVYNTCMFIIISCISVVLRPTALIILMPLILWQFKSTFVKKSFCSTLMLWVIIGSLMLIASLLVDFLFYGRYTNVYYNFFKFNIVSGISSMYGTHPWHWYFSQGLAVILSSHLVMFAVAIIKKHHPLFIFTILWTVVVYSFLPHKEFRFLSGLVPLSMHLCGTALHGLFEAKQEPSVATAPPQRNSRVASAAAKAKNDTKNKNRNDCTTAKVVVAMALLLFNVPPALYACLVHQRGAVEVMSHLAEQPEADNEVSVLFLMPCHSTPYYSHVHKNITMRFLTCEPNLDRRSDYVDEADEFFSDPAAWLSRQEEWMNGSQRGGERSKIPTHVVIYKQHYEALSSALLQYGLGNVCGEFFHTHFPTDRIGSHVLIVCR